MGLISLILTLVSMGLCAIMFLLANGLPNNPADFNNETTTPDQLRLLILGCSTAVLAIVALIMSVVALLLPDRSRTMALISATGSFMILLGVFGVIVLAIVMANSPDNEKDPDVTTAANLILPGDIETKRGGRGS